MTYSLKNKRVLITGALGTVGSNLISHLATLQDGPVSIIGLDNNETNFFYHELNNQYDNVRFVFCDIRDYSEVLKNTVGIDIVIHAAAMKHVNVCERFPHQATLTNITGTNNIISAALENGIERVLYTSSDKAVNPTNVMGTSKLMGERLISAANIYDTKTIFSSTRFGNVLGSNGSVIPIFLDQILKNAPITITSKQMTRFVMSIETASALVVESITKMIGGEVFITKMPVVGIVDLADAMIQLISKESPYTNEKVYIGCKPGEKFYEELMTSEEVTRSIELDSYFVVLPAFRDLYAAEYEYDNIVSKCVIDPYVSSERPKLDVNETADLLKSCKLF